MKALSFLKKTGGSLSYYFMIELDFKEISYLVFDLGKCLVLEPFSGGEKKRRS